MPLELLWRVASLLKGVQNILPDPFICTEVRIYNRKKALRKKYVRNDANVHAIDKKRKKIHLQPRYRKKKM